VDDPDREPRTGAVLAVVAAGGTCGAAVRHGIGVALPHEPGGWPWSTLLVNGTGCLLIGVLMAALARFGTERGLLRPFLGVGVLGGYTTFSTYAVEARQLVATGRAWPAAGYLAATVLVALVAVFVGARATHALVGQDRAAG
jgi:fluoride exporter